MAKKGTRVVVTLECTEARTSTDPKRSNGVSRYTTEKNRRNTTERLELKKFNPHLNRMTIHKEICLLYTSPSPRDRQKSRMPSSA